MRFKRLFLIFASVLLFAHCDAGTIRGNVYDSLTGEPLTGAVVLLRHTAYGAVAGMDGSYLIPNVSAGSFVLEIRYPSFTPYEQCIIVADSQILFLNVKLRRASATINEVVVTGKMQGGSDQQSRSLEKNSDNIVNIFSAHTIELLPDITVANVLQRVPGLAMQKDNNGEARYAIIRGMDRRYNYTTVDGIKIPSPDDKMRFVPMDIFPADIVERLEVIKTLTPDMEGDAMGGVMNLVMKDAPDHLLVTASAASGYNQTLFDRSYEGFPKTALHLKDPIELHGAGYLANVSDFQRRTGDFKNNAAPANGLFSFTAGNRFLKTKKLGAVVSGSYQNTFKGSNSVFFQPSIQPGENNAPVVTDLQIRKYSTQEVRTGLNSKINYQFNEENSLSLYLLYLQLDEIQTRSITDTSVQVGRAGAGTGQVDYMTRAAFRRQTIGHAALEGKHLILHRLKMDYSLVYSEAERDVPDMTELHTTATAQMDSSHHPVLSPTYFSSLTHSWERTRDADKTAFLNFTYATSVFGKEFELKTGGMFRNKERNNYYNDYSLQPAAPNQLFDNVYNAAMIVQKPSGDVNNDFNYSVTENITAGYIQAKWKIGKLGVLAGFRVENTYEQYSMNVDPNAVPAQNAEIKYTDLLPGIHLKYALGPNENLRISYFESISRPGFFELVPYHFPGEYYTETGNDSLNHSVAQNVDARYEWFPKGIDQLFAGLFYKSISNPIEYLLSTVPGKAMMGELMPVNVPGKPATNYGAEIVLVKYFHYFGVSANYTYTHSSITATKLSRLRDSSGSLKNYSVSDTRPLQGQSAHVANLALIYKNARPGFDAHISWVYTGRHIAFLSGFEGLDYWQKATSFFDFSCEKKIGKHISAYAKVNNLLNTPVIVEMMQSKNQFISGNYQLPYQTLPNSTLVEKDYYGRNYLVGIRYKLD